MPHQDMSSSRPQQGTKRKRAQDSDATKDGALQRMYGSEEWADLSIETPTKTFRVHKAVVCEMNPFMKAACTRGFVESHANLIKLPEDEAVIEAILQHFYEVPITLFMSATITMSAEQGVLRDRAMRLIDLKVAIDKYDVGKKFGYQVDFAFAVALETDLKPNELVEIGAYAWNHEKSLMGSMQSNTAYFISDRLRTITKDNDAWMLLCQNPKMLRAALETTHTMAEIDDFRWPCVRRRDR
ncbi:hypothetical protein HII31_13123 [Pseudocercospora fuligena]|uniref:BTB domain-containing protein n=1 Tax=Pseudocercospora fuligena TaxID=685502 RepID=A0A8H6R484_9PEZI|nr:hypothetical protein HII31_13123 [Pseudocercospora fuligena]